MWKFPLTLEVMSFSPSRVRYGSASLDDLDSLSHLLAPTLKNEVGSSSSNRGVNHGHAMQTQRRSNLGPQKKVVDSPLPPSGASAPRAEGGASKSLKISAKNIEANVPGKFYQPNETENVAESMAGKISKIIEMEDLEAVPPVGLIPRNVGNKSSKSADGLKRSDSEVEAIGTKRVTRADLEAAAMGRTGYTSRGTSRSNASMDGKEGSNPGNLKVSQSSMPDVSSRENASLASKEEVNTSESRTPSRRVSDDTRAPVSQANSSRTSSIDVRDLSGVKGLTEQVADTSEAEDRHEDSHHSSTFPSTGNQSLSNHNNLVNMPDVGRGVDEQRKDSKDEAPAGDGAASSTAYKSEEVVLSASGGEPAFHDMHLSEVQRRANDTVDTNEVSNILEETVHKSPHLPPIRIEEVFANEEESHMISATSPKISSQWSSPGGDDLRPSTSMLSRLSYSSELMPVSSGSEPESPVSPNSPTFNALYSPPGSPSRILGFRNESPPGLYMGSHSRTAHHSSYSSTGSEIPVLSLSPRSRLASPSVPWADQGDHAGPLRPPPPLPENSSLLESRQEVSVMESELYPLPSSSPNPELDLPTSSEGDGLPSQSIDGLNLTNPQENAEKVHAEPASRRSDKPDPLHTGDHFEASSGHIEQMQPSATYLETEVRPPSTTPASFTTEPSMPSSTSPFGLTDSATMQPSHKSFDHLNPRLSTESISMDIPSNGPTSDIDLSNTAVEEFEADPFSAPSQGPTPSQDPTLNPASSEASVHPTLIPLKQAINIVPPSFSVRDEESVPSSPTGTVIIRDSPSPPASPASNYSESESEIHEYHPSHDQPRSPMSSHSIAHGLEDVISYEETGSGDRGLHQDPRFKSSEREPTTIVSIQESGLTNSALGNIVHAAHSPPEDGGEASASDTSMHLDISHGVSQFLDAIN
jgi:hypothetical protein